MKVEALACAEPHKQYARRIQLSVRVEQRGSSAGACEITGLNQSADGAVERTVNRAGCACGFGDAFKQVYDETVGALFGDVALHYLHINHGRNWLSVVRWARGAVSVV